MRTRTRALLWGARPFPEFEVDRHPGWQWAEGARPRGTGGETQAPRPWRGTPCLQDPHTHTHSQSLQDA